MMLTRARILALKAYPACRPIVGPLISGNVHPTLPSRTSRRTDVSPRAKESITRVGKVTRTAGELLGESIGDAFNQHRLKDGAADRPVTRGIPGVGFGAFMEKENLHNAGASPKVEEDGTNPGKAAEPIEKPFNPVRLEGSELIEEALNPVHLEDRELVDEPLDIRENAVRNRRTSRGIPSIGFGELVEEKIPIRREVRQIRQWRLALRERRQSVGLVPTMGALHDGHLKLVETAAKENTHIIVSIYVNPTQFGVNEDLAAYPRTLQSDMEKLQNMNKHLDEIRARGRISMVFAPNTQEMYPNLPPTSEIDGEGSFVTITPIGKILEGASRPVFFRGVATVCMKLFNIVQPTRVYFGQKDIQQTVLVSRMLKDFHMDTAMRIIFTQREQDGLAKSSRNVFLGTRRRRKATVLYRVLERIRWEWHHGKRQRGELLAPALESLSKEIEAQLRLPPHERVLMELDYLSLADAKNMEEIEDRVPDGEQAIVSIAVRMLPVEDPAPDEDTGEGDGGTRTIRLIDNNTLQAQPMRIHTKSAPRVFRKYGTL